MRLTVRLFAAARQRAGRPSVEIEVPGGITVGALRHALLAQVPELEGVLSASRIAVASEYAGDDLVIPEDAEVAVIPPVSGGSPAGSPPFKGVPMIEITESPIDHAAVTDRVRSNQAGAVCSFLGTVREMTGDRRTAHLDYEAYPEMAARKLAELEAEARRRWPILEAALVHRVGPMGLGEISVVVAVSCPHRGDAFEACRWLMDALKASVPIWKKEVWADGTEEWVHPGSPPG